MFCNQCGEDNRNDRKFCTNCGAPLRDYTKPRENLIMPEEIEEKQNIVKHKNKIAKVFTIVNLILQLIVVTLLIVSFFVKEPADMILLVIAIIFEIAFFACLIIKNKIINKANKKIEDADRKEK